MRGSLRRARNGARWCVKLLLGAAWGLAFASTSSLAAELAPAQAPPAEGLVFHCAPEMRVPLPAAMARYLGELGIASQWVVQTDYTDGRLAYTLATPRTDTDTLGLRDRKGWRVGLERVRLPGPHGRSHRVWTVSKKEILLALMQHGRSTHFTGAACDLQALREHVALRQSMVAWAEKLQWDWPDGEKAQWNTQQWRQGTPISLARLDEALADAFYHQSRYSIGCYAATKLSLSHGIYDYYSRVSRRSGQAETIRQRLIQDGEPLRGVEPDAAWSFEADFDAARQDRPGKLVRLVRGIAPRTFVPGDWAYLVNTDPVSSQEVGYEGSNAIYLGRGRFADFYDDHDHSYTFDEKLDEVYQWRHQVFSRPRDNARIQPLTPTDLDRLSLTPAQGGLLLDWRLVPYLFGYEDLP